MGWRRESPPGAIRRYTQRAVLFAAPILLVLVLLEVVAWRAGETWPITRVIAFQRAHPGSTWARAFIDQEFYRYKHLALLATRPRIVVLGSSRTMQFRAAMFGPDSVAFYNAGGMIQNLDDLEEFARSLPVDGWHPALVILGIDMWWLNDNSYSAPGLVSDLGEDAVHDWRSHLLMYQQMLESPGRLATLVRRPGAGPAQHAGFSDAGFRRDGSWDYGVTAPPRWQFVSRERPAVRERIRKGTSRFEFATGLSDRRLQQLRRVLELFAARGITVTAFAPPLSTEAAELLDASPGHREFWHQYRRTVPALFRAQALTYVDGSTPGALGLDDRYLLDGLHAMESFHLHVLRRMLQSPDVARHAPGAATEVERLIASPRTSFWFID